MNKAPMEPSRHLYLRNSAAAVLWPVNRATENDKGNTIAVGIDQVDDFMV